VKSNPYDLSVRLLDSAIAAGDHEQSSVEFNEAADRVRIDMRCDYCRRKFAVARPTVAALVTAITSSAFVRQPCDRL
jgi:hypothetical protein